MLSPLGHFFYRNKKKKDRSLVEIFLLIKIDSQWSQENKLYFFQQKKSVLYFPIEAMRHFTKVRSFSIEIIRYLSIHGKKIDFPLWGRNEEFQKIQNYSLYRKTQALFLRRKNKKYEKLAFSVYRKNVNCFSYKNF